MDNIIIRNIKKEDLPEVVDIQINGWKTAYRGIIDNKFLDSMDKNERLEQRQKDYQLNNLIVAELNNEVVGFCRYINNNSFSPEVEEADCELRALYTRPDLKGNGIGTKLLQYVKDDFAKQGKRKMVIWCLKDNEPSKKFYTKMGGKIIRERETMIGDRAYSEVCFVYEV